MGRSAHRSLRSRPLGALVSAIAVFLPPYLFVVLLAQPFKRISQSPGFRGFVKGVSSAATGAIGGAALVLGRRAVVDVPTLLLATASAAVLFRFKKVPEPVVVLSAGVVGLALKSFAHSQP